MLDKKKVSIDFTNSNYKLVSNAAKADGSSNSTIINKLVESIIPINEKVRSQLETFCENKFSECYDYLKINGSYESIQIINEARQWKVLSGFFGADEEKILVTNNKKKIVLKNGYCIIPQDWICLDNIFGKPEECTSAYVVESRNSAKYNIPHFVIFCKHEYESTFLPTITEEMESIIYDECAKVFPDFKRLFNMQIFLSGDQLKDQAKLKEWDQLPCFGIFNIIEKDDPQFWTPTDPDFSPPGGAMIVRTPCHKRNNEI